MSFHHLCLHLESAATCINVKAFNCVVGSVLLCCRKILNLRCWATNRSRKRAASCTSSMSSKALPHVSIALECVLWCSLVIQQTHSSVSAWPSKGKGSPRSLCQHQTQEHEQATTESSKASEEGERGGLTCGKRVHGDSHSSLLLLVVFCGRKRSKNRGVTDTAGRNSAGLHSKLASTAPNSTRTPTPSCSCLNLLAPLANSSPVVLSTPSSCYKCTAVMQQL